MAVLSQYDYIFAIGTFFAMLDAFNNGANDVANAWATSVSSRSISYRWAMVLAACFELLGALTVGARTADTIKNEIIPLEAFRDNAGVQMLAFTCALAGASIWVMWCTTHSAHVSSTYSLISSVAGVGVATAGAANVNWGWHGGKGLGAIFAGLFMAPAISACFASIVFMLVKTVVHMRSNPTPWAIYTSPVFFLIAGTVCALSIVYKGSPKLGLDEKPPSFIAAVSLGTGGALAVLAALFFVPWLYCKVIKKDAKLRFYHVVLGPLLWKRQPAEVSEQAKIRDYAVVQHDADMEDSSSHGIAKEGSITASGSDEIMMDHEKGQVLSEVKETPQQSYEELMKAGRERFHAKLRKGNGPLGWAMRTLHDHPMGAGEIYEFHNIRIFLFRRLPAMIVVGALYGLNYDIHAAQIGNKGTPEAKRMERTFSKAAKYSNEVEHTYSFVQIITACTASFAHGANDIGNAAGPWAVIYSAWKTGDAAQSESDVPLWQLAVLVLVLITGFVTYGYNIMRVMGNKLTYHSPSRGSSMEMGAAITVLMFSQFSLPVSTSMCITGATVGVGLCNGSIRAVNWQRVGLLVFSWIMTIPVAGTIGGLAMGIVLNAPHFVS